MTQKNPKLNLESMEPSQPQLENTMSLQQIPEYVLTVRRDELTAQGIGTDGIYQIDTGLIDPKAYCFTLRAWADNKSDEAVAFGKQNPQVLPYFLIQDKDGRILTYRRKGKEEGLLGKYSIGVGGHIDLTDADPSYDFSTTVGTAEDAVIVHDGVIQDIIQTGLVRELSEEVGITISQPVEFDFAISTYIDKTSQVHLALVATIGIDKPEELKYDPAEFNAVEWLTAEELKARSEVDTFEPWSQLIVDYMND